MKLETGRTHQIRVHLAAIDLPVVGDRVYGVPDKALGRQFLHASASRSTIRSPSERIEVESPLPDDLAAYLGRARQTSAQTRPATLGPSTRRFGRMAVPLGSTAVPSGAAGCTENNR